MRGIRKALPRLVDGYTFLFYFLKFLLSCGLKFTGVMYITAIY